MSNKNATKAGRDDKEIEIAKINSREKVLIAVISGVVGIATAILGSQIIPDRDSNNVLPDDPTLKTPVASSTPNSLASGSISLDQLPISVRGVDAGTSLERIRYVLSRSILIDDLPEVVRGENPEKTIEKVRLKVTLKSTPSKLNSLQNHLFQYEGYDNQTVNFLFDRNDETRQKDSSMLQHIFHDMNILKSLPNDNVFCTAHLLYLYSEHNQNLNSNIRLDVDVAGLNRRFPFAMFDLETIKQITKDTVQPPSESLKVRCSEISEQTFDDNINTCECINI